MVHWFKISHLRHSGKVRPHEHTSYLPLGIILVIASIPLSFVTAGAISPGPVSSSVGLSGTMPGKPPKVAATINTPTNGQHFSTSPITLNGNCGAGLLVEIYKNDIFAGSTQCDANGTYSLMIDPIIGQNKIVAKIYDALNQPGPDSTALTIYYDALTPQSSASSSLYFGGPQLLLNTNAVFRGTFPDQSLSVPIDILAGTAPYALNINWGDTHNSVISRPTNITFNAVHSYKKAGTYQISIQASDASQRVAFLTVAAIVNGQPAAMTASTEPTSPISEPVATILMLWPLYTGSVAVVASFWLGEKREKRILQKHGLLLQV